MVINGVGFCFHALGIPQLGKTLVINGVGFSFHGLGFR